MHYRPGGGRFLLLILHCLLVELSEAGVKEQIVCVAEASGGRFLDCYITVMEPVSLLLVGA